jgi:hypothetical protein
MYTFNNNLLLGDIILVRGAGKNSKLIAKYTNGHFSHAMIVLEHGRVLEAITGSGVQLTSTLKLSFKDKKNLVVLRCKFPDHETKTRVSKYIATNYAHYQGRAYSLVGAMNSITSKKEDHTKGDYFCSHLVAAIYSDSGFPLLEGSPHKVTPNDLLDSELLQEITDAVLRPYSDITLERVKKNNKQINCIDAGGKTVSQDALNHQKLLKNTKKYFTRNGLPGPKRCGEFIDILTDPKNTSFVKKLDYQISREYKNIGINKFLMESMIAPDFPSDFQNLKDEIQAHGYFYALDAYTSYNALITGSMVKYERNKEHCDLFKIVCERYRFKYAALKLEYYSLIRQMSEDNLKHFCNVCMYIEETFPESSKELEQRKSLIVAQTMSEQVAPTKLFDL